MKKVFAFIITSLLVINTIPATSALKESAELKAFLEQTGTKYKDQISEIEGYLKDIDYSLKKQLYENKVVRKEIIESLPQSGFLNREQFFRLYIEFEMGAKRLPEVTSDPFYDIPKDDDFAQIAAFIKSRDIFTGKLGYFYPEKEMTRSEMKQLFPGVEDIYISDQDEPLDLSTALNYFYRYFKPEFPTPAGYEAPTKITLDEKYFYNNGKKIEGIFAHWHVADELYSDKDIRETIQEMKAMGIIGVATEVPWSSTEKEIGKYTFPARIESLLKIAQEEKFWVTLTLAPHYVPNWVDVKYGDDYKIKDKDLNPVDQTGFMTYSLHGPAVEHVLAFQKKAINHYADYDNILAIFLSNEPGYAEEFAGDYSNYSRSAYFKWCEVKGYLNCHVPEERSKATYVQWQEFNRESLTNYLNATYHNAKDELDYNGKFIPLSHKIVPYFLTNPHSADIALDTTPAKIDWDFIAVDIYGYTPHLYDLLKGYKKPILVAETNFIDGFDRQSFYEFLLNQYLHGAGIQTVYKWEKSLDKYALFAPSGKYNENAHALVKAATAIQQISANFEFQPANIALVIPKKYLRSTDKEHRTELDSYTNHFINSDKITSIIWSDDLDSSSELLENYTTLIIHPATLKQISLEIDFLDSPILWQWIKAGGTLILPPAYSNQKELTIENGKIKFCNYKECEL